MEVFLAHPGGPLFARKDDGHWTIPKGETDGPEDLLAAARREFTEETGLATPDSPDAYLALGSIRQKSGKIVHAWAFEGDADPAAVRSNTFSLEWPPKSGRFIDVPEVDRAEWFTPDEAARKIKAAQAPLIEALLRALRTA